MIVTDEAILRLKCEDVLPEEVADLKFKLETELALSGDRGAPGIGLAAPQIGIQKRMAIVRVGNNKVDLVNCKIANRYDKAIFNDEGCLSFPGQSAKTYRYREIHVVNNLVAPHSFIATGLFAVCIQHELDHLDGILLPDVAIAEINAPIKSKIDFNTLSSMQSFSKSKK